MGTICWESLDISNKSAVERYRTGNRAPGSDFEQGLSLRCFPSRQIQSVMLPDSFKLSSEPFVIDIPPSLKSSIASRIRSSVSLGGEPPGYAANVALLQIPATLLLSSHQPVVKLSGTLINVSDKVETTAARNYRNRRDSICERPPNAPRSVLKTSCIVSCPQLQTQ